MKNNFRFVALDKSLFDPYFNMGDAELSERGIIKMIADEFPGFPCRVSLEDAQTGEEVILLHYDHFPVSSPYKAGGPIFIRKKAKTATPGINEIPKMFNHRLLSVRGFDKNSMMIFADVTKGDELDKKLDRILEDKKIEYIHLHNAKPGCFNCRVERV
jgi:hypothetical protein